MVRVIEAVSSICARVTSVCAVVMAAIMIVCLLLQIVFRYLLNDPLTWSEEVALFTFAWVVLLLGSLGVREAFHVRLTFVLDRFSHAARLWLERAILVAIGVFGVLLAVSGYRYVEGTLGAVSAAVGYPIEALHAAAPVCGVLIVIHALARLLAGPEALSGGAADE